MIFGEPLLRYEVVGSTQDIARDLAAGGAAPGIVVAARFQTEGRGRRGKAWYAPPGANVCLTAVAPPVPAADAWQVALVAGVAAAEGVREVASVDARVRFPNDVLVGGRKLAGVLVEAAPHPDGRVVPLIGIGINVNVAEFPPGVRDIATSLLQVTGAAHCVATVEGFVLRRLGAVWEGWRRDGLAGLLAHWTRLLDPAARRTYLLGNQPVVCRIRALDANGILTLETADGAVHALPAAAVILGED